MPNIQVCSLFLSSNSFGISFKNHLSYLLKVATPVIVTVPALKLNTVELQWVEHRWLVYHGYFELVLGSLGKHSIAADVILFGIIKGDFLFYIDNVMLCVLIRIASMRRFY